MHKDESEVSSSQGAGKNLTVKQTRFVAAYADPHAANGNGVLAAKMAGYRGGDNQLGVQASANLRNPKVRQTIAEALDAQGCTLERAVLAVADAMSATKRRGLLDKGGNLIYTESEPDHRTRLRAAAMRFRLQEVGALTEGREGVLADETGRAGGAGCVEAVAQEDERNRADEPHTDDVVQLDPTNRALVEQVMKIDQEVAQIDNELEGGKQKDASEP